MKKLFLLTLVLYATYSFSQGNQATPETKPFIEVTGTAQKEVVPDRIYLSILLVEKTANNQDFSIQIQDEKLKAIVYKNNIDKKDLFLSDAFSEVTKNKKKETGIKLTRQYTLILKNAEQVTKIFQELTDVNIKEITIDKTGYSDMETLQKEVRTEAIKAAKNKAEYLLTAIGNQIGEPLQITEFENKFDTNLLSNSYTKDQIEDTITSFEKITVKFSYYIKYEIK